MRGWFSRLALWTATWEVVAVLMIAGALLLLAAAWLALGEVLSPTLAALSAGGVALVAAAVIGLVARGIHHHRRSSAAATVASLLELAQSGRHQDLAAELGALLGRETASTIEAHPHQAVIAAAAAGFIIGINPRLRESLRDLLK